jgi:hypothetical protein
MITFPWSDAVGGIAGLALAYPHFKDQYFRFQKAREQSRMADSPWPDVWSALADTWNQKRAEYDGFDSAVLIGGALALVLSFALKAGGL